MDEDDQSSTGMLWIRDTKLRKNRSWHLVTIFVTTILLQPCLMHSLGADAADAHQSEISAGAGGAEGCTEHVATNYQKSGNKHLKFYIFKQNNRKNCAITQVIVQARVCIKENRKSKKG